VSESNQPSAASVLTALVVDDEPLARIYLRRMLEEQGVTVAGEADTAVRAIEMAEDLRPNLLFLDIQMPGLTGLQLAEALQQSASDAQIIFVTGYSEYAMQAFEQAALDYLVKPVSPVRLARSLVRARERLADTTARAQMVARVNDQAVREMQPLRRLPIRKDYSVLLVRVEEIITAMARDKRVFVRTAEGEHRTYYTLTQLESLLPPNQFLRVHDSCIVNLDMVEEVLFLGNHTYALRLTNGEQIPLRRTRYPELQRRLRIKEDEAARVR
jgi:DNA-binding LytR/AlgR family response regulator